jgi:hypothetical protein
MDLEHDWKTFYECVAGPEWPSCPPLADAMQLPNSIRREIISSFDGYRFFMPNWEFTTRARVDLMPVHSRYDFLLPVQCLDLIRLGSVNDGGYVLPKSVVLNADSLLSGGISDNWDFEQSCVDLNANLKVHAYDKDVDTQSAEYAAMWCNNKQHHSKYLGNNAVDISDALTATTGRSVLVKLDIEGAEYECIDGILEHSDRVTCLVIEFHNVTFNPLFVSSLQRLQEQYTVVHLHANNAMPFPPAQELPYVLEVTLVRKDLVDSTEIRNPVYLYELDSPNLGNKCDYFLYFQQKTLDT